MVFLPFVVADILPGELVAPRAVRPLLGCMSAVFHHVVHVVLGCTVSEVNEPVVTGVTVAVAHVQTFRLWPDERPHDETVYTHRGNWITVDW